MLQEIGLEERGNIISNLDTPTVCGLEQSSKLFSVLAGLYTDIVGACIRENATNAADACREAGVENFTVTLPTVLSPELVIKDQALGLSRHDLENVYTVFLKSTKDKSNDDDGYLGLGAKAAGAYADTYTVTSCFDGMKYVCIATKNAQNIPQYTIQDLGPTDEPNGITVSIPVLPTDIDNFQKTARGILSVMRPRPIITNEERVCEDLGVKGFYADNILARDELLERVVVDKHNVVGCISTTFDREAYYVLMGNVLYAFDLMMIERQLPNADSELIELFHNITSFGAVICVERGDVIFTPSREHVNECRKSAQCIYDAIKTYIGRLECDFNAQNALMENPIDAVNKRLMRGEDGSYQTIPKEGPVREVYILHRHILWDHMFSKNFILCDKPIKDYTANLNEICDGVSEDVRLHLRRYCGRTNRFYRDLGEVSSYITEVDIVVNDHHKRDRQFTTDVLKSYSRRDNAVLYVDGYNGYSNVTTEAAREFQKELNVILTNHPSNLKVNWFLKSDYNAQADKKLLERREARKAENKARREEEKRLRLADPNYQKPDRSQHYYRYITDGVSEWKKANNSSIIDLINGVIESGERVVVDHAAGFEKRYASIQTQHRLIREIDPSIHEFYVPISVMKKFPEHTFDVKKLFTLAERKNLFFSINKTIFDRCSQIVSRLPMILSKHKMLGELSKFDETNVRRLKRYAAMTVSPLKCNDYGYFKSLDMRETLALTEAQSVDVIAKLHETYMTMLSDERKMSELLMSFPLLPSNINDLNDEILDEETGATFVAHTTSYIKSRTEMMK